MISVNCNGAYIQTTIVWKDGLKYLGQKTLNDVTDEIRMEGR